VLQVECREGRLDVDRLGRLKIGAHCTDYGEQPDDAVTAGFG